MFIELEPIFLNEGSAKEFCYEFSAEDCTVIGNVSVKGRVENRTGIVSINAQASFVLDTVCDRCAASVKREMCIPVAHLLIAQLHDENNDDFILVEDMHFNLDELVREDILLALPVKVLCRDDCKGLCQYCGKNLNEGECLCKKPVDPRLQALAQLLVDEED